MRVRGARNADIPAIEAVVADAFAAFLAATGIVPAPMSTDWETVISALGAFVAIREDRVVGVLVMWPHPDHVLVETLAVAAEDQGGGVGTALLDRSEVLAVEGGTDVVRMHADAATTQALAWCQRHGFVDAGRRTEHGYERVHLEKRLA